MVISWHNFRVFLNRLFCSHRVMQKDRDETYTTTDKDGKTVNITKLMIMKCLSCQKEEIWEMEDES